MTTKKLTYEFVKNYIESFNYKLLSKEYINSRTKLYIQCDKGHKYQSTHNNFWRKRRCPECYKFSYNKVKEYIDSFGYNHDIDVHNNTVERCPIGIAVSSESGETVENIFIYQNVIRQATDMGIVITAWHSNGLRKNVQIINNEVYDSPVYPCENCELFIEDGANVEDIYISDNVSWS